MLSRTEKQIIRRATACFTSIKEVKGKPVTEDGKPFIIPTYPEILAKAMSDINALGFSNIRRTSPRKANCIVRVFSTQHYHYDDVLTYNVYGFTCYTKEKDVWVSEWNSGIFYLDYSKFETTRWLCQDEQIVFNHDFADFFLHIG